MRDLRSILLVSVVAPALLLAGCGGGDDDSACGLLTDDEAQEILGVPTGSAEEDDESLGPETSCSWVSEDSTTGEGDAVFGLGISAVSGDEARADFEDQRDEESDESTTEDVDGLGDDAYFVVDTDPNALLPDPVYSLPYLEVRVGDQILTFTVFDSDERPVTDDEAREFLLAMADLAVPRAGG